LLFQVFCCCCCCCCWSSGMASPALPPRGSSLAFAAPQDFPVLALRVSLLASSPPQASPTFSLQVFSLAFSLPQAWWCRFCAGWLSQGACVSHAVTCPQMCSQLGGRGLSLKAYRLVLFGWVVDPSRRTHIEARWWELGVFKLPFFCKCLKSEN